MTVTSTMPLAEQLSALAKVNSFDVHAYRVNSRGKFSTEYVDGGQMRVLIPMLRAVGVEPAGAAAYDRLAAVELPRPVAPQGRRLNVTPEAYAAHVRDVATYRILHREAEKFTALERDVLLRELQLSMRGEVEVYLTALRAPFDSAMADFTKLVELGLTVGSTSDDAVLMGSTAIDAWKKATMGASSSAKVLDGCAGLRIRLSAALGVQPVNTESYASAINFGVCFGVGDEFDKHNGYQRWLAVAATGTAQLRSVEDVNAILAERQRSALRVRVSIGATSGANDD